MSPASWPGNRGVPTPVPTAPERRFRESPQVAPGDRFARPGPMRALVCEGDGHGLLRLVPRGLVPGDDRARPPRPPAPTARALPAAGGAEGPRADGHAGRPREACVLLLNRAVELLSLSAVRPLPGPSDGVCSGYRYAPPDYTC